MKTKTIFCALPNNAYGFDITSGKWFISTEKQFQEIDLQTSFGGCMLVSAGIISDIPANVAYSEIKSGFLIWPLRLRISNGPQLEQIYLPAINTLQSCRVPLYSYLSQGIENMQISVSGAGATIDTTYTATDKKLWAQLVIEAATENSINAIDSTIFI
jgi:hypothetical protein